MNYFGHTSRQWEGAMMGNAYGRNPAALQAMQDAMNNPQNYTTARPNLGTKPSFTVGSTRGAGSGRAKGPDTHYYRIPTDPRMGELVKQQQAFQQQMQATAAESVAANTKQLRIIQGEKSAVSKMTQDYTAMLQKEADAKAKAQEAARVSAATSTANQARQGQTSNLQIQPASSTPRTAGTQAFKRRQLQFKPQTYGALASTKSGTLNI